MNLDSLTLITVRGTWYRGVKPKYFFTSLDTTKSSLVSTRFNPGPLADFSFEILYLAQDEQVALFETRHWYGDPYKTDSVHTSSGTTLTLINVSVRLQAVVDLTDPLTADRLGVTAQLLTGDWQGYSQRINSPELPHPTGVAPTQRLAESLAKAGHIEGFLTYSAKIPTKTCLNVFPENLREGSSVSFRDPDSEVMANLGQRKVT